jgi:ketosteroid isomerase-like protein
MAVPTIPSVVIRRMLSGSQRLSNSSLICMPVDPFGYIKSRKDFTWLGRLRGHEIQTPDEVRRGFFGSLAETQTDRVLNPEEFIAHDDKLVMIGRYSAVVTATNKRIDLAVVHVFTIQNGKITRFLNFTDSARLAEAYKPS